MLERIYSLLYIFPLFTLDKKWVSSQAHFRSHDQLMIMIMSCSSTTPTWKIPSCDVVTLSSNDIENWYSPLWKGLNIKASMLLKGLSLFEIHSNWTQACLISYVWSIISESFQVIDQLDKKKKVVVEQQTKGEKLTQDPKAPKFLITYIDRLKALWVDANKQAEKRLTALKGKLDRFDNKDYNCLELKQHYLSLTEKYARLFRERP